MSKYINDPREMEIRPESGVTLEEANRIEPMYHWGAMVVDYCGLPMSEYMKPMTVIVNGMVTGGTGGDTSGSTSGNTSGTTSGSTEEKDVNIYVSIVDPDGNEISGETVLLSAPNPILFGDSLTKTWKIRWRWTGDFNNAVAVAVKVTTDMGTYTISDTLRDNNDKLQEKTFSISAEENVASFQTYGVAKVGTQEDLIVENTYQEEITIGQDKTIYKYVVSTDETCLNVKLILWNNEEKVEHEGLRFGNDIQEYVAALTKDGYTFNGWFDINGNKFTGTTMPAKNFELYARWAIKSYPVTFYIDDAIVSSCNVVYKHNIPSSAIPSTTKEGHTFSGWDNDTNAQITAATEFRGSYTVNTYVITWNIDGVETTENVSFGSEIPYPSNPEKEGYNFVGWSYSGSTMPANDINIEAQFEIKTFTYTFLNEDGSFISSGNTTYGSMPVEPNAPTKESTLEYSYTFNGWDKEITAVVENVEYTAVYDENVRLYTIKYFDSEDSENAIATYQLSAHTVFYYPETLFKDSTAQYDYTHIGWTPEESPVSGDKSYYAVFSATLRSYEVKFIYGLYHENEFTVLVPYGEIPSLGASASVITQNYADAMQTSIFNGWNRNVDEVTGETDAYYAVYNTTTNKYDLIVNGEIYGTFDYATNVSIREILESKYPDYLDSNKYTGLTISDKYGLTYTENDNILITENENQLTISAEKVYYSVVWKNDGEVFASKYDYEYGETVILPENDPNRDGHTFIGWVPSVEESVIANAEYNAEFIPNEYTLSYVIQGGPADGESNGIVCKFGDVIIDKLPKNVYDGYEDGEWLYSSNDAQVGTDDKMPASDLDVKCIYRAKIFSVIIKNDDDVVYTGNFEYGTEMSEVFSQPEVESFISSSSAEGYTIGFSFADNDIVNGDLVVTVTKVPNVYTLTFMNGDNEISSESKEFGSIIEYPEMAPYTDDNNVDWSFKWDDEKYNGAQMPVMDLTIYGHYESATVVSTIYFGCVLNGETEGLNYSELGSIDASECMNTSKNIDIVCKKDEYYAVQVEDDDWVDEHEDEYRASHMYPICVFVPSNYADNYNMTLAMQILPDNPISMNNAGTVMVDGTEYVKFMYEDSSLMPRLVDTTFQYVIKLTEK